MNFVLILVFFFSYSSSAAWMPFFNVYLEEIGFSGIQIGTIAGVRPALIILIVPIWGMVADLWGHRRTLLFAMLLTAFTILGFGLQTSFWFLLVWSALLTLLSGHIAPLIDSMTLSHLDGRSKLSYGHFRFWGSVGWMVTAFVVGFIISGQDLRLSFVYAAVLGSISFGIALMTPRNLGKSNSDSARWDDLGHVLRSKELLLFLAMIILLQIGASPIFTFYPIYLAELGASSQMIGLASALLGLSELPFFFLAAAIVRRIGHVNAIGITFLFFAARAFLFSFITDPALATAVQVLHAPFSLFLLASVAYINEVVPDEWRATGQALLWAAFIGVAGFFGNILAGSLYDRFGSQMMFRLSGFFIVVVVLVAMLTLREKPVQPSV